MSGAIPASQNEQEILTQELSPFPSPFPSPSLSLPLSLPLSQGSGGNEAQLNVGEPHSLATVSQCKHPLTQLQPYLA